ncbi:unnamed protein product [Didymodactylos carnosus]|uniref:Uncharacterized protein n=1 Tax=Didymodactylos carnosus TaxID=1234261 RepID=A0A814KHU6_9BILA|nr:unnamed protein product [Didymodactylos carnosus]CAF1051374.1 unnamed protein product [Didymodactylos carnosus]CAF3634308.1 unnamed protein product [Didymodactylos carnosus]CAF3820924.1 unnamed protein product [Didymodactylos carnosus]
MGENSPVVTQASNVYLFKNGYGMVVKKFELPPNKNDGKRLEIVDPPLGPVHGTFWIQTTPNVSVYSIRTKKTHKLEDKKCVNIEELVQANIGENVELLTSGLESIGTPQWITGTIKSTQKYDENMIQTTRSGSGRTVAVSPHGHLVFFEGPGDRGLMAVPMSYILSIRSPNLKTNYQRKIDTNCLSIDYKNDTDTNGHGLMKYLTFGITWAPSYNINLITSSDISVKLLRLSSKCVVLNDIENIQIDQLSCIVGHPNMSKFVSVIDPLMGTQTVQQFLDQLSGCETGVVGRGGNYASQITSNSIMTQQAHYPTRNPQSQRSNGDNQEAMDGADVVTVDDLHLYEFKNILLQEKERILLPIFDIEVPYKDVYHCKIDQNQQQYRPSSPMNYDEQKQNAEVWHSVEFDNKSDYILTTAPVLITRDDQQFIGQDTLNYTLKNSSTFVNLTKALDIRVTFDEKVNRAASGSQISVLKVNYVKEILDGVITVINYKLEPVTVVIKTQLRGRLSNFSLKPKTDLLKVV